MYIYLSKKINVPNSLTCCSWNRTHGFVAAGCDNGVVKVIKLEMSEGKEPKPTTTSKSGQSQSNNVLLMNETLDGHSGEIASVTWNDKFNKLTTADSNGKIIVWINYEGQWCEEMVNKRDNTTITGMKWSPDGLHICIIYNDGVIIMGSLEGTRIWVKEMKNVALTNIEWSPDKSILLIGLNSGDIQIFDFNGNYIENLKIYCLESLGAQIAAIDWYNGQYGHSSSEAKSLAICYVNGRCQLMKNEHDEKPIILECQMAIICAQWNHDGTILAIGGVQVVDDKETNIIQFYNSSGEHLKTLKVPGNRIKSCTWEGTSLRLVIAIDSLIYFANLRPTYKWCYTNDTVIYSFTKAGKNEQSVMFFDTKTGEMNLKYMKNLLGIVGNNDHCALICQADDSSSSSSLNAAATSTGSTTGNKTTMHQIQYAIVLCNLIGTPLEYKYIDFEPYYWAMNSTHLIVASKSYFYLWNYVTSVDRANLKKQSFEKLVFIENPNVSIQMKTEDSAIVAIGPSLQETRNQITCIAISDKFFFIGREVGYVQKFSLSTGTLSEVYLNESNGILASKIFINSTSSRMALIDTNSTMRLFDLTSKVQREELASFKRSDVWHVTWANDNADMFASMEKIKLHIFRDTHGEDPVSCSGYICEFSNLEVKVLFLDDIISRPENPMTSDIVNFDSKLLRDARAFIDKGNYDEAIQFIEINPHDRLWRLLAESSLNKIDLKTAEIAFVKGKDYYGIEFIKKLQTITNQSLKKAEIAAYFNRFDEAESIYLEMDRKDLAYQMRKKLGDWFKVLQLLKLGISGGGGNASRTKLDPSAADELLSSELVSTAGGSATDSQLEEAYNEIGEYYAERQKYDMAVKFFILGRNVEKQAECYYIMENYEQLVKLMDLLPENSELLEKFAQMFESVGMCKEACEAYLKAQNVKAAVDACVRLNQWDEGMRLAKQYNIGQVDALLAKQASSFLAQNKIFNAIELYRKARHYLDSARLMFDVADREAKQRSNPLLIKKMYVLSGLLVEQYRELIKAGGILPMKTGRGGLGSSTQRDQASRDLDGILTEESQIAIRDSRILDNAWRGAEAYHFTMLCERQLRENKIDAAFKTSMALMEYEDILNPKHIYSLIALCACGNGSYNSASKAFIKLESCETIEPRERKDFESLAFQIFSYHAPKDKKPPLKGDCPQCGTQISEWHTNCPNCDTKFAPCIVSGRPILEPQFWVCGSCKHRAIETEIANRISCPLCHMPVR